MLKKIKYIFYLLSFFTFVISTTSIYFSDQNIRQTNKSRSIYLSTLENYTQNLPLLKNDTKDIITYRDDVEVYKRKKKSYKFWSLLGK